MANLGKQQKSRESYPVKGFKAVYNKVVWYLSQSNEAEGSGCLRKKTALKI